MSCQPKERPQGGLGVFLYLIIPTLVNSLLVASAILFPNWFQNATMASYVFAITSFTLVTTSFIPTFKDNIADLFAITVLVANVALFILFNAGLHLAYSDACELPSCQTFIDCLYFSIVTYTTLGYGDFQPVEKLRLLSAFHALFGYLSLGFIVAIANDLAKHGPRRGPEFWGLAHIPYWFEIRRLKAPIQSVLRSFKRRKKSDPDKSKQHTQDPSKGSEPKEK